MSEAATRPDRAEHATPPSLELTKTPEGLACARAAGAWRLREIAPKAHVLSRALRRLEQHELVWDLSPLEALDAVGAAMLWRAWRGRRPAVLTVRDEHDVWLQRAAEADVGPGRPRATWSEPLVALGRGSVGFAAELTAFLALCGQLLLDLGYLALHPGRVPWREISANVQRSGARALPITALVGFLIGIVVSYLSARQLQTFGGNVLIVNLLGISIVRELGPLLAAILTAGRSGSAMTAQIGVMRVTQELDALSAMGVRHSLRLVLPKVVGLTLALPLVVVWTDAVALAGGMLAAEHELRVPPSLFLDRLPRVVAASNLWIGVGKAVVFGFLIASSACHFGLRVEPNSQGLSAGTTRSVVAAITLVIVADAVFAVALARLGIR